MSDTPQTDKACQDIQKSGTDWHYSATLVADFARELERDNAMLRATCRTSIPQDVAFARYRDYEAMKARAEAAEALVSKWRDLGERLVNSYGRTSQLAQTIADHVALTPADMASVITELRKKTAMTLGVGEGSGELYVHGDYDSIKACQAKLLEHETLRATSKTRLALACELQLDVNNLVAAGQDVANWFTEDANGRESFEERIKRWNTAVVEAQKART